MVNLPTFSVVAQRKCGIVWTIFPRLLNLINWNVAICINVNPNISKMQKQYKYFFTYRLLLVSKYCFSRVEILLQSLSKMKWGREIYIEHVYTKCLLTYKIVIKCFNLEFSDILLSRNSFYIIFIKLSANYFCFYIVIVILNQN